MGLSEGQGRPWDGGGDGSIGCGMDENGSRDSGWTEGNSVVANGFGSRGGQSGSLMLASMIFDKDNPAGSTREKGARSRLWIYGDRRVVLTLPSTWLLKKLTNEGVKRVLTVHVTD